MKKILILFPFIAVILASCVHEYPDATTPAPLEIEFSFDMSMAMPELKSASTKAELSDHQHDLRYQVRAYKLLNSGKYAEIPVASFCFIKDEVNELVHVERVSLAEGRYRLLAWVDYIDHGSNADLYYNTQDFNRIRMNGDWKGSVDDKDVFIGECEIDLVRYGSDMTPVKAVFELSRPVAKFEIITSDFDMFKTEMLNEQTGNSNAAIEDYYAVVSYETFIPDVFDLTDNTVRDASLNYSFKSSFSEISETEAILAYDYILIKPEGTKIGLEISFYDKENKKLSSTGSIDVPLARGHVTRITGEFLSKESQGGISINPDFEDDYNIEIK